MKMSRPADFMRRSASVPRTIFVATSLLALLALAASFASPLAAQETSARGASLSGRVTEASTAQAMWGVAVTIEGTGLGAVTDSAGRYRIVNVPPGPQVLRAQRLGYSPTRINVVVPATGSMTQDIEMARHALTLRGVQVNADPMSRARGELGTASVIEHEAIKNQVAASLAGILELVPGVPLQVPGLDGVQQISLRSVPISGGASSADRSAQNLASFGTLIVIDGVPLSNNANLQSLGRRGELGFSSAAGGGIDLRRIPAATIERVEVIRGVPSARWGDLTHGAIIVDTRAGAVEPAAAVRVDASTTETSLVGGTQLGRRQTATLTSNVARTRAPGGTSNAQSTRIAGQLAHRAAFGGDAQLAGPGSLTDARLVLDTRFDFYRLTNDRPEVATVEGRESHNSDVGTRILERLRLKLWGSSRLEWTAAYERGRQRADSRGNILRGATPITNRTEPGRQVGRYVGGIYNAAVEVGGDPSFFYSRGEISIPGQLAGFMHDLRLGTEVRREANQGSGVQFDIEFPPQQRFNGVRGFDRPRSFSSVPPFATTGLYLDDRLSRSLGSMLFNVQVGARLDVLHEGGSSFSGARDVVLQPRFNVELAPSPALRIRAGAGRLAKSPSLGDLYPSLDYYDVINVNHFANEPAERLAVLTTFIFDPTNPDLGYSVADRAEAGLELRLGGSNLSFTAFADKTKGGVGINPEPTFVMREHFDLTNTDPGSGRPPDVVEPASSSDSVPVLIDRPSNNLRQRGSGFEITADFPEIPALRTRIALQGALVKSRLEKDGIEFAADFPNFQISQSAPRSPYYESVVRTGERFLLNTRLVHHQPQLGLVITGTVQHTLREIRHNVGGTDTLAFVGYITRGGALVPVPVEDRTNPEYSDIRLPRSGVLSSPQKGAVDWLFNLQVSKTLPRDGRLSFYAFNAFDRTGHFGSATVASRVFVSTRFGVEVTIPVEGLIPWR